MHPDHSGKGKRRPSKDEIQAAAGKTVPDLIAPGLRVLFCGINPSLYSAAVQYHFARPGNRFWPTLHRAGYTARLLDPAEESMLLDNGFGITNIVDRATANAAELSAGELTAGVATLEGKLARYRPRVLAMLGITAYRTASRNPRAAFGLQPEKPGGTPVWVLPNPSGLNAHYQVDDLARLFQAVRAFADG